jgi:hypothetical protein
MNSSLFLRSFIKALPTNSSSTSTSKINLEIMDQITLQIFNPKTVTKSNFFRTHIYEADIRLGSASESYTARKTLKSNDYDDIKKQITDFLNLQQSTI